MRSDVEREIEADARSLAESVFPPYDPDADDLTQGPMAAWIELDPEDGSPILCTGMVRGETEDSRRIRPRQVPDHMWDDFMELIDDFDGGDDPTEAAQDAWYARLGDTERWAR